MTADRPRASTYDSGPAVRRLGAIGADAFEVVGLRSTSPVFPRRSDAEAWLAAALAKLPERARPRVRSCLCCGTEFASTGPGHRLCGVCRREDAGPVAMAWGRPKRRGEGAAA